MAGVFHAYDVRGIYGDGVDEELAYKIGLALPEIIDEGPVGIGFDMRPSSPSLVAALAKGLRERGRDVVDLGMLTTPAFYYSIGSLNLAGGLIVTASHNPAEYNGFKICREKAIPIGRDSGLLELEALVEKNDFKKAAEQGKLEKKDVRADYLEHVLSLALAPIGELRIAIDCANGVAGPLTRELFKKLPQVSMEELYFEPDGTFPNHEANPLKTETLDDLRALVREQKLDLGVAFDGDGDRCAFVDEDGGIIASDLLTAFLAEALLDANQGAAVIYDLRSSRVVEETILSKGGRPIEERVGHAFIKKTMRENNAIFGGELSGHYYWRDNFFADSAFLTVVQVLALRSKSGKPLSELIAPFRRTFQSGEVNFVVEDKDGAIAGLADLYKDGAVSYLDGITVKFEDWWFNVRKSNTEPLLRLNLEAQSQERMDAKLTELSAVLGS